MIPYINVEREDNGQLSRFYAYHKMKWGYCFEKDQLGACGAGSHRICYWEIYWHLLSGDLPGLWSAVRTFQSHCAEPWFYCFNLWAIHPYHHSKCSGCCCGSDHLSGDQVAFSSFFGEGVGMVEEWKKEKDRSKKQQIRFYRQINHMKNFFSMVRRV